jgi:hypothetical protein
MKERKTKRFRIFRIFLRIVIVIIALFISLVLALNIPAVQTFIISRITSSIREKTGVEARIGSVKIAFPKTVAIKDVYFQDKNADTLVYLGSLHVNIDLLKLFNNKIIVNSLELENLVAHVYRNKGDSTFNYQFIIDAISSGTAQKSDTSKPKSSWVIMTKDINLKNIHASYNDEPSGLLARVDLGDFKASVKDFDLSKKKFVMNEIFLNNTSVQLTIAEPDRERNIPLTSVETVHMMKTSSSGPDTGGYFLDWNIHAGQLTIENTNFALDNASVPKIARGVDYSHLNVRKLNTVIRNASANPDGYSADIKDMSFTESSGFNLLKLSTDAKFTGNQMEVKNLLVETPASKISADASLTYSRLSDLTKDLGNCGVMLDLKNTVVNPGDLFLFVPALASGNYIITDVRISAKTKGKINDLDVENLEISLPVGTTLRSNGRFTGLPDVTGLGFDASIGLDSATLKDVYRFIDPTKLAALNLPETFNIKATVKGKTDSLSADVQFSSRYGNITTAGFYQNFGSTQPDTFNVVFTAENVLAGTILSDTILGEASFSGNASGSGISSGTLFSGRAMLEIQGMHYNSYFYKNIRLDGQFHGNEYSVAAGSADPNLDFKLSAYADLSGEKQKFRAQADISMLNLNALHFTQENISIKTSLKAELRYAGINNLEANLGLVNTRLTSGEKVIPVNELNVKAYTAADSLNVRIRSDLADGQVNGNIMPEDLLKILQSAYHKYFGLADTNQIQPGKHLAIGMVVHIPQIIMDQLMPELDSLKTCKLDGIYTSRNNEISFKANIPGAIYSNVHLDSLNIDIAGKNESLSMDLRCGKILYDKLQLEKLQVKELIDKGAIRSMISISDSSGKPRYFLANAIELKDKYLRINFLPEGLILSGIAFKVDKDYFLISNDTLNIEFSLENEQNKISINGKVDQLLGARNLDLDILLDINNLGSLEPYVFGALSGMSGKLDGKFSLRGNAEKPEIDGFLGFEETAFKVNSLNFLARINDQKIEFNNQGVHFKDFEIEDAQGAKLIVNGDILTNNLKDIEYDLKLVSRNFEPINSTAADNPLFFGKLSLDTDIKLKGIPESPKIEANVKINSATNLTYVMPGSELKMVSSEGVVHFLKSAETHDSLYILRQGNSIADSLMSRLTGMNLSMSLEIDPDTKFTVDIDPKSGDYLTIGGSAKLNISVNKAGKQSINGIYEVKSGIYQLSFYDLVKKTFTITPGSTISWSGKPMDADLNISAAYIVTTPSVGLVASETTTMTDSEKAMFQQRLPYEVRLNIRGQLAQPEISFNISLPEKYLTTNPLIAAKLAQLNTEEMANELNKQVFALLVTGTFIADNSGSSSGSSAANAASTAARNSVNGILADQMNKVSGKYIRQVDINFGLTTFDDGTGGSSDQRTELDMKVSKKLLKDRLTVEAQGSVNLEGNKGTSSTSTAHNSDEVAITYDLTKSGEYKLRAYYQTGYDLFDGDITYSGIAVIFEREYDSLKRQKKMDKENKKGNKQGTSTNDGMKSEGSNQDK